MKVRTLKVINLGPGVVLTLSEQQAHDRAHALSPTGDGKGRFLTTGEVCFKIGEEIGIDGELPKALAELISPIGTTRAKTGASTNPATLNIG